MPVPLFRSYIENQGFFAAVTGLKSMETKESTARRVALYLYGGHKDKRLSSILKPYNKGDMQWLL